VTREPSSPATDHPAPATRYYQLTHDYLVPSLREWLTRKQKETRRGRAELRLAERASVWSARPEKRNLPTWGEWANIWLFTHKRNWSGAQRRMMTAALRHYGIRGLSLALVAAVALISVLTLRTWLQQERDAKYAAGLVARLKVAETSQVPAVIEEISGYRRWVDQELVEIIEQPTESPKDKLHARLALLPVDSGQVEPLRTTLLDANPSELLVIRAALVPYKEQLTEGLWQLRADVGARHDRRFRAACALAAFDPGSPRWNESGSDVVAELLEEKNPVFLGQWIEALRPVRLALLGPLTQTFRDKKKTQQLTVVASVLADYAADQPDTLSALVVDADAQQFKVLFPGLIEHRERVTTLMKAELSKTLGPEWGDVPLDPSWLHADPMLAEKFETSQGLLSERFAFCQTMPLDQFEAVAERLRPCGYRPTRFRPYSVQDSVRVAAAWVRDGRDWRMAYALKADAIRKQDAAWRAQGYLPLDAAGYILESGTAKPVEHFAALWVKPARKGEEAEAFFGLSNDERLSVEDKFKGSSRGYAPSSLHVLLGIDGSYRFSSIWRKGDSVPSWRTNWGMHGSLYAHNLNPGNVGIDVCLHQPPKPPANLNPFAAFKIGDIGDEQKYPSWAVSFARKLESGIQKFGLGKNKEAIADLSSSIGALPIVSLGYSFRAMAHARLGHADQAKQDLALSRKNLEALGSEVPVFQRWHVYADVFVSTYLGEDDQAMKRLESFVADHGNDPDDLFIAARATPLHPLS
jgi:hypothetical protein